jgi:four helix bundle protein
MAHKVDELPLFGEAQKFSAEVSATLQRSTISRSSKPFKQIVDANESITANMDEGFDQESDDGFARYLYYSKGSIAEVMRRLRRASATGDVDTRDVAQLHEQAEVLGKMIGGFIKYLKRSGFRDRGRFRT